MSHSDRKSEREESNWRRPCTARTARLLRALLAAWGLVVLACDESGARGSLPPPNDASADPDAATTGGLAPVLPDHLREIGFSAVWGSSADNVWIVGGEGTMLRFDGQTFHHLETLVSIRLVGVHGTSRDDVWVVGDLGTSLHWNGTSWQTIDGRQDAVLLGVWSSRPDNVWMVGALTSTRSGWIREVFGEEVRETTLPACNSLWKAWSSEPQDIWLIGSTAEVQGVVLHGDGKRFEAIFPDSGPLRGIWGSSRSDVWIVPYDTAPQHWDGSTLTVTGDVPEQPQLSVWGSSPTDVWSVGLEGSIRHFDGTAWSSVESGTNATLWSVWGSSADDVWIVGNEGTVLRWRGTGWMRL
jgi:hypothetical protein